MQHVPTRTTKEAMDNSHRRTQHTLSSGLNWIPRVATNHSNQVCNFKNENMPYKNKLKQNKKGGGDGRA